MLETPSGDRPNEERVTARIGGRIQQALIIALLVVIGAILFVRVQTRAGNSASSVSEGSFASSAEKPGVVKIAVTGMRCDGCAGSIEGEIRKVPGVADCKMDVKHKVAVVTLADRNMDRHELIAAVEQAGYEAAIQR